jgi:hypothetical protein
MISRCVFVDLAPEPELTMMLVPQYCSDGTSEYSGSLERVRGFEDTKYREQCLQCSTLHIQAT